MQVVYPLSQDGGLIQSRDSGTTPGQVERFSMPKENSESANVLLFRFVRAV
jgi:hypothetical protein